MLVAGPKLAGAVSEADTWVMLNKVKDFKATIGNLSEASNNDAGTLAVGTP